MKQTLRTIALIVAFSGFSAQTQADTLVLSDNFDSYPLGTFGSAYNFGDPAASPSSAIVAPELPASGRRCDSVPIFIAALTRMQA
jgi:hypothetical protein